MKNASFLELKENLKDLKLSTMARELESHVRQAKESGVGYDDFLLDLTIVELSTRAENRTQPPGPRRRNSPCLKTLEGFDYAAASGLDLRLIRELVRMRLYPGAAECHLPGPKRHRQDPSGDRTGYRGLQEQLPDPFHQLLRPGERADRSSGRESPATPDPAICPLRSTDLRRAGLYPLFQGRGGTPFPGHGRAS